MFEIQLWLNTWAKRWSVCERKEELVDKMDESDCAVIHVVME